MEDTLKAQKILEKVLPYSGKSIRIGVTGVPGVGKSTFIEALGLHLISKGNKVAVLAIDPSSPVKGGSILGDKIQMEKLSQREGAFIRPSPSAGAIGGVAGKTRESISLCEAAGYNVIIIETVGVGQSEVEVASMVDYFLLLLLPGLGDELQGIKKGVIEVADILIINKADGNKKKEAWRTKQQYQNALNILSFTNEKSKKIITCSALEKTNIEKIWSVILNYRKQSILQNTFEKKRSKQNCAWMRKLVREMLDLKFKQDLRVKEILCEIEEKVANLEITPYQAANKIFKKIGQSQEKNENY